ncbi:hypothetical protein ACFQZ8_02355 [Micromonospora azadirachtae]|uniref:Uncharacterized protein n=1 Tax=Micromonospora azadirachtae TaxID=1970735 RepID=A0ABW2ZWA4_9ACTN
MVNAKAAKAMAMLGVTQALALVPKTGAASVASVMTGKRAIHAPVATAPSGHEP